MSRARRTSLFLLAFLAVAILVSSCAQSGYPSRRQGHPKGCNCPRFN